MVARVGAVAYRLKLSAKLNGMHDTFHVSNLRKFLVDKSALVSLSEVEFNEKLSYVEEAVQVLDKKVK